MRAGMLDPRPILLLFLAACGGSTQPRAETAAFAEQAGPCPCLEPPVVELETPTRDHVRAAMEMAGAEVRRCYDEPGTATARFAVDGASGRVGDVYVVSSPDPGGNACAERVLRRICFPRFRKSVFRLQYPFTVGGTDGPASEEPWAPRCPASAATPPSGETQRELELARARAREGYQARYGQACERLLAEQQAAPPAEPLRELDNATKRPVLQTHIEDIQRCYRDALAGWPDLQGKLELQLVIAGAGNVEGSRVVSSTFPVPELACCLREVVRSLRFPATPDGSRTSATYDFAFTP